VGRHPQPCRLLEAVGGEEHRVGEVGELRTGLVAQLDLGHRGRDMLGGRLPAQERRGVERVLWTAVVHLRGAREQRLPLVGQQPPERVEIHDYAVWHST